MKNVFHTTVGACLQAELFGQSVLSSVKPKVACKQAPTNHGRPPARYASLKTHFSTDSLLTTRGEMASLNQSNKPVQF
jgi:hypothetical protein